MRNQFYIPSLTFEGVVLVITKSDAVSGTLNTGWDTVEKKVLYDSYKDNLIFRMVLGGDISAEKLKRRYILPSDEFDNDEFCHFFWAL